MKTFFLAAAVVLVTQTARTQIAVTTDGTAPHASAMLDVKSPTKGFLMPRVVLRTNVASPATGLMVYETNTNAVWVYNGTAWVQLGSGGGNTLWATSPGNINNIYSTNTGSVGIGTNAPFARLHVGAGSIYLQDNRNAAVSNPFLMFDIPGVDYKEGGLQWRRNSDTLASIKYIAHPTLSNYIKITAAEGSSGPATYINNTGLGVGTADPQTLLHLRKFDGDELLRLDGANPQIKLRRYVNIASYEDVGFLQTSENDLRIGTYSSNTGGKFIVRTGGGDNLVVNSNGNTGIGTDAPLSKVHVQGGDDADLAVGANGYLMLGSAISNGTNLVVDNNEIMVRSGYTAPGTLNLQADGGNLAIGARTTINADGEALKLNGNNATINFFQNDVFKSFLQHSANGLYMGVNDGDIRLDVTNGQVAIGPVLAGGAAYKLAVAGKVICEELKVKLSGSWPDYVFTKNYRLPSLREVEQFIQTNNHLPNIPKAADIEKSGLEVGDMQKRMMEKIEELTLYVIDLQKQIEALKAAKTNKP